MKKTGLLYLNPKAGNSGRDVLNASKAMSPCAMVGASLTVGMLLIAATPAVAADAGSLLQQIEKERPSVLPKKMAPAITSTPEPMSSVAGEMITVTSFQFVGNSLQSKDQLAATVASYLNHPVSFSELKTAAIAVAEAYRKAGWVVRAYLPQQDIKDGVVTIQIVEAVFGKASQEGTQLKRVNGARIQATIDAAQAHGQPINTDKLDRALLILDDLSGVVASGSLQGGDKAGETDLIIKASDESLLNGDATLDNTGARSTGSTRLAGNFYLNSPAKIGDQATANLIHTNGSDYARLAYSLPVGNDGLRVGGSASSLVYRLVAADFIALQAKGSSSSVGLDTSYPILRSRSKNLYVTMNYDQKSFNNEANRVTSSNYTINDLVLSLSGNLFDDLAGGGSSGASVSIVQGQVALGALNIGENAALNGGFSKARYSLNRLQFVTEKVSLYGAISGQKSSMTLDSSEKFYLGGAGGVRAYPASEGSGSSGNLTNLELRYRLPAGLSLTGFYDYGNIQNYDGSKSYSLAGKGVALDWQASYGLNLKATLAQRNGNNPNPMANGNDQDGSLTKNRLWLQATMPF
jgi:hemolysin activation/secretion protein